MEAREADIKTIRPQSLEPIPLDWDFSLKETVQRVRCRIPMIMPAQAAAAMEDAAAASVRDIIRRRPAAADTVRTAEIAGYAQSLPTMEAAAGVALEEQADTDIPTVVEAAADTGKAARAETVRE